jgi:hypothetical protein
MIAVSSLCEVLDGNSFFRHSGLDPESRIFQIFMYLDAPRIVVRGRILKSGMTGGSYRLI